MHTALQCLKLTSWISIFMVIQNQKKTHPYLHKDGKNCYEKESTSFLVKFKCKYFFQIMKTYP